MSYSSREDSFFKIDPECHIIGDMEPIKHFPGVQMWWKSVDSIMHSLMQGAPEGYLEELEPWEMQKSTDPENILRAMDKYGVDIACLLPEAMMDTTGYTSRWFTNGDAWKAVQTHPDRFIIEPNLSPIKQRGVKNAILEMEYWVEQGAKIFKYYSPEDTYLNDPDLWPFYKRAEQLGIVLDLHTGFCWCPPGKSKYCQPIQLDDVARDFPGLKLVAFHMGYPYCDDLNLVAMGHPNIYLCLSLLIPWAVTAPYKFAKILGEAMRFTGPDRIVWGTDSAGYGAQIGAAVLGLRDFQMPEELQWQYGYLPLTDDDKDKIFGGNLAGLLGIDTSVRRVGQPSATATTTNSVAIATRRKEMTTLDSVYDVVISTPMGELPGKAVMNVDGNSLSGSLFLLNHDNPFSGGSSEDGKVTFKGELQTPMGKMTYSVTGTLMEGKIEAVAKTKMGELLIRSK
ncbi:MAG: amidohydrolase family protein [Chloroflexota bacterium]